MYETEQGDRCSRGRPSEYDDHTHKGVRLRGCRSSDLLEAVVTVDRDKLRARARRYKRNFYHRRREAGLCVCRTCARVTHGHVYCELHRAYFAAREREYRRRRREAGVRQ